MDKNINTNNDEIDLLELFGEFKKRWKLIAGTTLAFAAAAAIYSFAIAKPVYEYTAFIRFPNNVSGEQIYSFMETIKDDIKPEDQLKDKVNKIVSATVPRNTRLIRITFEGESVEKVKEIGSQYMSSALNDINGVIVAQAKQRFAKEIVMLIQQDTEYISSKMHENSLTAADADGRLKFLVDKVQEKEKNQLFINAEFAKDVNVPEKPVRPKKAKNIVIATVLGLFMSSLYVLAKCLISK